MWKVAQLVSLRDFAVEAGKGQRAVCLFVLYTMVIMILVISALFYVSVPD
jgi:competence protein ComGC